MVIVLEGKKLCCAVGAALLACALLAMYFCPASEPIQTSASVQSSSCVWIIDAGHGGEDGGAVAADGTKESEINLAVARRVEALLRFLGERTRMTRTTDASIHSPEASSLRQKKRSDLENRVAIVNETQNAVLVSIHQNSFPDASVSGPQVFYFEQSAESSAIASVMQDTLNNSLNPPKPRVCKSNNDYYILKKTPTPIIIVECGFLSNETEAALLVTDAYQEKLVRAVYLGAITYLESGKDVPDTAT